MSEAELHQIKLRLHQGERQKAARGEVRVPLPAGLAYGRDGRIGFNPGEEVHAAASRRAAEGGARRGEGAVACRAGVRSRWPEWLQSRGRSARAVAPFVAHVS